MFSTPFTVTLTVETVTDSTASSPDYSLVSMKMNTRILAGLFLVTLGCCGFGCRSQDAEHLFEQGKNAVEQADYDIAIDRFSEVIRLDPDRVDAYYRRGIVYGNQGQLDQAIADFSEAIRLQPEYVDALVNRGIAYGRKVHLDKAITDFSEVIRLKPDHKKLAVAYSSRGVAYGNRNQQDKAIADFNEAIRIRPDFAKAYYQRATAYVEKGMDEPNASQSYFEKADTDYQRAHQINPVFPADIKKAEEALRP